MTEQNDTLITIPEVGRCLGGEGLSLKLGLHHQPGSHGKSVMICLRSEHCIWVFITRMTFYYPSICISNHELRTGIILVSVWQNPAAIDDVEATKINSHESLCVHVYTAVYPCVRRPDSPSSVLTQVLFTLWFLFLSFETVSLATWSCTNRLIWLVCGHWGISLSPPIQSEHCKLLVTILGCIYVGSGN